MAKLRGLESAKEMQTSIQTLAGQVAQSKATVQEAVAYLTQLEKKLAAQEADAVKNAQEQQAQAEQPEAFSQEQEPARSAEQPAQQEPTPVQAEIQKEENPVKEIQQVSPAPSAPQAEKAPEAAPKDVPVKPQPVKAEPARQEPKAEPVKTEAPKTPAAQAPRQAPAGRDFLKANRPPMPKNPSAYAMRPPRPQGDRPARPAGDRPPRPQGDRPMGPRPAGDRPPRPQGDRPMGNRPPRPQGERPMGARPAGQGRPARSSGPDLTPAVEKERVSNYDPNKSAYQRVYDVERKAPKAKKDVFKENIAKAGGLDDNARFRKQRRGKTAAAAPKVEAVKITHAVMSTEKITVKDLTEKLGKPAGEIIKRLFMLGIMATINNEIDYDTANLVAQEFGIELEYKPGKTFEETLSEEGDRLDDEAELVIRPPVVTIMGHVDHGKTSLLDKIRSTSVTKTEAGGITQHIGAYTVTCDGRQITFLDTPGHEAFTAMRARGAQATDIAILVVAADDGIMPQTIEAINHAKAANVPIIVAINKMDRPTANPDRIMQQLTEYELVPEEWGGSTIVAKVSALTGDGIDELLQMILLVADVNEYKANPDRKAKGIIIEAKLDKGRGPVSTVLVQNGTLRVGDTIVAGTAFGRVRAMIDDKGNRVEAAGPSMPVEVIGFNDVPNAGDILNAVEDERLSRQVAQERKDKIKAAQLRQWPRSRWTICSARSPRAISRN
jgi:translation initiation factor IF-2